MSRKKSDAVLFIMQLPPPVHGVSVMNSIIRGSALLNSALRCEYINLATASDMGDLRRFSLRKVGAAFGIYARAKLKMLSRRYRFVYITVFPWGAAFIKDSLVVLLARMLGQKPLLHLHTYGFKSQARKSKAAKAYYRLVFKGCEVICLSPLLMEDIEEIYHGKVHIVPNGIPKVNFTNAYNAAQKPVNLLYLSNLIEGKGILLIMEAVKILAGRGIEFQLHVAGPEADVTYGQLRAIAEKDNTSRFITFHGPKYGEEKHALFRQAGIFLLPSNYDTFGLVLLEAMQFGVPCIATRIGGIPDVIGEGRGVLLEELTPESIADSVAALINDPAKREQMSSLGFTHFSSNFTVDRFEQRLLEVLQGKDQPLTLG